MTNTESNTPNTLASAQLDQNKIMIDRLVRQRDFSRNELVFYKKHFGNAQEQIQRLKNKITDLQNLQAA